MPSLFNLVVTTPRPEHVPWRTAAALLTGAMLAAPLVASPAQEPRTAPSFLGYAPTLSRSDLSALDGGNPVVSVVQTTDRRDVAVVGVIAVNVPQPFLAQRLAEIAEGAHRPGRTGFGLFSTPATAADLTSLAVLPQDVAALRGCHIGSCAFKLPAAGMDQLRAIIDSAGASAPDRVAAYLRDHAAAFVEDVRHHGFDALPVYNDFGKVTVAAHDALESLLAEPVSIRATFPSVYEELTKPREDASGETDAIFWARDEVPRVKPTLTINRLSVFAPPNHADVSVACVVQLVANHYFEAAFDMFVVVAQPGQPEAGAYVMLIRRYRFDHLSGGWWLFDIRQRVIDSVRDRTVDDLRRLRSEAQTAFPR